MSQNRVQSGVMALRRHRAPNSKAPGHTSRRRHASTATIPPNHIAVLGGGISGLTAAFHLGRRFPNTRITLIEAGERLGAWIRTETVDLGPEYGQVVLEAGPRTLRPVSKPLLELIHLLGLQSQLLLTPKTAPAAMNRYICLLPPDGNGLKVLPSSPLNLFKSPFFITLLSSILKERYWPDNRIPPIPVPEEERAAKSLHMNVYDDESVDSFLTRRFGHKVARLFGSALVHGVYAADSRRISVRASFPSLWDAADRGKGSVITGIVRKKPSNNLEEVFDMGDIAAVMKNTSVFSFQEGIEVLPVALSKRLGSMPFVQVRLSSGVAALEPREREVGVSVKINQYTPRAEAVRLSNNPSQIQLQDGTSLSASHVVSALPLDTLDTLLQNNHKLPHLTFNPSSTVTVVNLVFPCSPHELHPAGFGYLVPRPLDGYESATGLGILGTVFDSCALDAQDRAGSKPITKLTVMCGGPYEDKSISLDTLVDELFRHIRRARVEPIHASIHKQVDCIPVPLVGHLERMKEVQGRLEEHPWNGRLGVVGAGVYGAGISDCIKAGREIALGMKIRE